MDCPVFPQLLQPKKELSQSVSFERATCQHLSCHFLILPKVILSLFQGGVSNKNYHTDRLFVIIIVRVPLRIYCCESYAHC